VALATPVTLARGGTGVATASDAALLTAIGALQAANDLSDLASVNTALANLYGNVAASKSVHISPDPAAITGITPLMEGMGATATYTPEVSGDVIVVFSAFGVASAASDTMTYSPRYGTGAAPANAAALTGTAFGGAEEPSERPVAAGGLPIAVSDRLSLVAGTAYWFDCAIAAGTAILTAQVTDATFTIFELPK
jgi:hypothetical protein